MSREVQAYFGYDGVVYANQRHRELLDAKIEELERELARLKKLRRDLQP